jgi:hypothetical protein
MNDRPEPEPTEDSVDVVDWWASRVVDREVEFADVPAELRAAVHQRASDFDALRIGLTSLGASSDTNDLMIARAVREGSTTGSSSRTANLRRIMGPLGLAAALVAVVSIGINVVGRDSNTGDDVAATAEMSAMSFPLAKSAESMAVDAAPAPAEAGASVPIDIADMVELAEFTDGWWTNPPNMKAEPVCPAVDEMQAVDLEIVFAGQPAEIHFGSGGLKVLSIADCMVMAGITP